MQDPLPLGLDAGPKRIVTGHWTYQPRVLTLNPLALGLDIDPRELGPGVKSISLGPDANALPIGLDVGLNNFWSGRRTLKHWVRRGCKTQVILVCANDTLKQLGLDAHSQS